MSLSTLINSVCDNFSRTDITAQASAAVVTTIKQLERYRWWFQEQTHTFTTTSNTTVYALPSGFKEVDYLEIRWPGDNWQRIRERDFAYIRTKLEGQTITGYPEDFAIYNDQIHLAYQPNDAYPAKLYYVGTVAFQEGSASLSNAWLVHASDVIDAAASKTLAIRPLRDREMASMHADLERMFFDRLRCENEARVTTGRARPHY